MTVQTATACTRCGAASLGTRFCESCGAPASFAQVSPLPAPTLPAGAPTSVGATPVRVFALIFFLLANVVPGLLGYAINAAGGNATGVQWLAVTLVSLTGLMAFVAALAGRAGGGGKAFGALFAIGYVALAVFLLFGGVRDLDGYTNDLLLVLSYYSLYLSWALGRPFRGRGYFGLLLLLVVGVIGAFIEFIPGIRNSYLGYIAIADIVFALSVWMTVGLSVVFEGKGEAAPSRPTAPIAYGQVNSRAKWALIVLLSAIGLQVAANLISLAGIYFVSLVASPLSLILLILAIVFGHVGLSQIRRTGERGRGRALAALIVSYVIVGLGVALVVVQLLTLAALSTTYYGE